MATFSPDGVEPKVNDGAAAVAPTAGVLPKGVVLVALNLNFEAAPSSALGPLNMKAPPAGIVAAAAGAAEMALPPNEKTGGCAAAAEVKLGAAGFPDSDISDDFSDVGAAAGALELVPNAKVGGIAARNVGAPPLTEASCGVSVDFTAVALVLPSALVLIMLLPNRSGVVLAEVVAMLPKLLVWLPNIFMPLLSPNTGPSVLGVAVAAAPKDSWVSLVSFAGAGVNADVAKLVTKVLPELLTLGPPLLTVAVFFVANPLDGSLFSTEENRATFFLGVSDPVSLNKFVAELGPLSSPFSLGETATGLGAANLGVLKMDESLASNGFVMVTPDTSLTTDGLSFLSADFSPKEPNTGVLSSGFLTAGNTLVLVSGAVDFGKPKVKVGTAAAVVTEIVSPLVVAEVAGWLDFTPNVNVAVLAAADTLGMPKVMEPAGLSGVPNLAAPEVLATPLLSMPNENCGLGGSLLAVVASPLDGSFGCSQAAHFVSVSLFCTQQVPQLQPVGFFRFCQSKPPLLLVVAVAPLLATLFFALPQAAHSTHAFLLRTKHSGHSHVSAGGLNLSPQLGAFGSSLFSASTTLAGATGSAFCWRWREHFEHSSALFLVKQFMHVQLALGEPLMEPFGEQAVSFDSENLLGDWLSVDLGVGDNFSTGFAVLRKAAVNVCVTLLLLASFENEPDVDGLAGGAVLAAGDCVDLLFLETAVSELDSSILSSKFSSRSGFENTNSSVTSNFGKLEIFSTAFGKLTGLGLSSNLLSFLRVTLPPDWAPVSLDSLEMKRKNILYHYYWLDRQA